MATKPNDVFDLDALEHENKPRPFAVRLGGETFEFGDPYEVDWQQNDTVDVMDNAASLKLLLGDEQYERFRKHKLSVWKLQKLNDAVASHYRKYYGSAGEGNA